MSLIFKRYFHEKSYRHGCGFDKENKLEKIIASFLTDTAGSSEKSFFEYLEEQLLILDRRDSTDWSLDTSHWGCDLVGEIVHIYFLFDENNEDYMTEIELTKFRKILRLWIDFYHQPIKGEVSQTIDFS